MRVRSLGKTGLRVSEMAIGTWGLAGDGYGPIDAGEARRVLERALEIGFTCFDTSDSYGGGQMEKLLGEIAKDQPDIVIVTKGGTDRTTDPARKRFDKEYLRASIERSRKRLGRDRLDLYLLHNPTPDALAFGEASDAMKAAKAEGLIAHWGVSAGDYEVARIAIERGAEVIEIAYNLFHSTELHRLSGEVMVSRVGVLARSPLCYGLLAGLWAKDKTFAEGDHRNDRWTRLELERRIDQLDAIRFLVHGDVHSMRGAAVRYVLANNLVTSAILGPRSIEQLEQLVREVGSGPVYIAERDLSQVPQALEGFGISS